MASCRKQIPLMLSLLPKRSYTYRTDTILKLLPHMKITPKEIMDHQHCKTQDIQTTVELFIHKTSQIHSYLYISEKCISQIKYILDMQL